MGRCFICNNNIGAHEMVARYEGKRVHMSCQVAMLHYCGVYEVAASTPDGMLRKGQRVELKGGEALTRNSYGMYEHHRRNKLIPKHITREIVTEEKAWSLMKRRK
jgi:hypothetical protein